MRNFFKNKQFITNTNFKSILTILALFTAFIIISAYSYAIIVSQVLYKNIYSLHILSNSDSYED